MIVKNVTTREKHIMVQLIVIMSITSRHKSIQIRKKPVTSIRTAIHHQQRLVLEARIEFIAQWAAIIRDKAAFRGFRMHGT